MACTTVCKHACSDHGRCAFCSSLTDHILYFPLVSISEPCLLLTVPSLFCPVRYGYVKALQLSTPQNSLSITKFILVAYCWHNKPFFFNYYFSPLIKLSLSISLQTDHLHTRVRIFFLTFISVLILRPALLPV